MYRQHGHRLLIAFFLLSAVAFPDIIVLSPLRQLFGSGEQTSSQAVLPLSNQQTTVARPTLALTQMPLTALPVATIRVELTATAQQATALALTPVATLRPTPTQVRVAPTPAPTPSRVPEAGQVPLLQDSLVVFGLALFCMIGGGALIFISGKYRDGL